MKKINVPVNSTYHEVINDFAKEWEKNKSEKYKEYRRKWSENPKAFILEEGPLHLDIEPTNACNLKCPMCPRTVIVEDDCKKQNFNIGMMDFETYKRIIDEAAEIGVYSIKLNWLGEPLIHPQIVDMVRYAKRKGIVDVMFNTNAALLTEELSRKLIDAGLDKIFFSFDSPHKENYEAIRIGAKFDDTLNNIKKLVQIRSDMGKKSPVTRVSMVLMEDNKKEYKDFVKLFENIVDTVAYVEYCDPNFAEIKDAEIDYENKFACSQLWQRMFIAWDGDVIPCCADTEKELLIGNINGNTIKNIWNSEKYNKIRENHKKGQWYKYNKCRKCEDVVRFNDGDV